MQQRAGYGLVVVTSICALAAACSSGDIEGNGNGSGADDGGFGQGGNAGNPIGGSSSGGAAGSGTASGTGTDIGTGVATGTGTGMSTGSGTGSGTGTGMSTGSGTGSGTGTGNSGGTGTGTSPSAGCGGAGPATTPLDPEEQAFLVLINDHRAQNGVGPVAPCVSMNRAAQGHSEDMRDNNYFSHTSQNGDSPWDRMCDACFDLACTGGTAMGENIAAGNSGAAATFQQWKSSPGHNANMLNPSFTMIGIGRATGGGQYGVYWTNVFAGTEEPSCY